MSDEVMEETTLASLGLEEFDFDDCDFDDEEEVEEGLSKEELAEFTKEEDMELEEVMDNSINEAFDKAEAKVDVKPQVVVEVEKPMKASVSPRANTEAPVKAKTKAKKAKKAVYEHPQFIKRKAGDKFLKDEEIVSNTAEFKLDDVTIVLVLKKSKTVKAFLCDETSFLNVCDVTDDVTTITLEEESKLDERAAMFIIRQANEKFDLGIATKSPKGDNINTRTLGSKVVRALNEKLKVKAVSV
jgi:hypothetical protein